MTHYYVQRHRHKGERSYLVRRQEGREPSPLDVVVREFEQQADAHEYAAVMNRVEDEMLLEDASRRSVSEQT